MVPEVVGVVVVVIIISLSLSLLISVAYLELGSRRRRLKPDGRLRQDLRRERGEGISRSGT